MRVIDIKPSRLIGTVRIPPSKSLTHRAIVCAALADGKSTIKNVMLCDDVMATIRAVEALGVEIEYIPEDRPDFFTLGIYGRRLFKKNAERIDCRQSSATLRFLIPLALLSDGQTTFTARGTLTKRPLDDYYALFEQKGIHYLNNDGILPLSIYGSLKSGEYHTDTAITSQHVSALLMALPGLKGDSSIILKGKISSRPYINMTIDMLLRAGVEVDYDSESQTYIIPGGQEYRPFDYTVEADFSSAANWIVVSALGHKVYADGLDLQSLQADKALLKYIADMGGKIIKKGNALRVRCNGAIRGIRVNIDNAPDLLPILAVLASAAEEITQIVGIRRLKYKESDRIKTTIGMINALGGDIAEISDGLVIKGVGSFKGGTVHTGRDHRIAMAAGAASAFSEESVVITHADCVYKSYPFYWDDLKSVGGTFEEYYMDGRF